MTSGPNAGRQRAGALRQVGYCQQHCGLTVSRGGAGAASRRAATTPSEIRLTSSCERTSSTVAIAPITTTIATMVAMVRYGNSHIFSVSSSERSRRRRTSWETAIPR